MTPQRRAFKDGAAGAAERCIAQPELLHGRHQAVQVLQLDRVANELHGEWAGRQLNFAAAREALQVQLRRLRLREPPWKALGLEGGVGDGGKPQEYGP